ncbi:MAG: hypothetical protein BWZ10_02147 [candidate division BRC1 bacterium ADurb.BinA364]|nr:MAG: hypothetical protein BWZ10_02147 [candidate division BRC1 bacterium ADurb.BinA364]
MLGFLDQMDDFGQFGVVPGGVNADFESAWTVDCARQNQIARLLARRHRFAGHCALIDRRPPRFDGAVDGNPFARAHDRQIAWTDEIDRQYRFFAVAPHASHRRRQRQQRPDRASGAPHGEGLQAFADEHDKDDFGGRGVLFDPKRADGGQRDRHGGVDVALQDAADRFVENAISANQGQENRRVVAADGS